MFGYLRPNSVSEKGAASADECRKYELSMTRCAWSSQTNTVSKPGAALADECRKYKLSMARCAWLPQTKELWEARVGQPDPGCRSR